MNLHKEQFTFDEVLGLLVTIDATHREIHKGTYYQLNRYNAALSDAANEDVLLQVGNCYPHFNISGESNGAADVYFYEEPTFSASGTSLTPRNQNRTATSGSNVICSYGPTISDVGTTLAERHIFGATQPWIPLNDATQTRNEWVLKPNTSYLLRVTNTSGTASKVFIEAEWYE